MAAVAATRELLLVKRQLTEERERHKESEEAERNAEAAHARLIEQMEKNYAVAQRVHAERARREESDHFAKGLREQMRSATARAVKVASEVEKEKSENSKLRNALARMRSAAVRDRMPGGSRSALDRGGVSGDDAGEVQAAATLAAAGLTPEVSHSDGNYSFDEFDNGDFSAYDGGGGDVSAGYTSDGVDGTDNLANRIVHDERNEQGERDEARRDRSSKHADVIVDAVTGTTTSDVPPARRRKKRKSTKTRKNKKRRPKSVSGTARRAKEDSKVPLLSSRPHSAMLLNAAGVEEKLRVAKSHNADLFRRLADAKRQARSARAESKSKSEQLHALSNHLEKMMALLRAEAAAKASAEDALRSTEDELQSVKRGKTALARELAGLRLSEKEEMKRDSMLSKQLELMDEKYATLLRTNNFNRAREARESKDVRAKLHAMAESMHAMMRRCEDANIASRNTVHAFSRLVSGLGLFDRTPFRVLDTVVSSGSAGSSRHSVANSQAENVVMFELQDCSLGDEGALAVVGALNAFVSKEAEKQSAVKNTRINPHHAAVLQAALRGGTDEAVVSPSSSSSTGIAVDREPKHIATIKPVLDDLVALRRPPVHIGIDLSFNDITDKNGSAVVKSLCRSIVCTHSITEINLRGNRIGPCGLKMILDALQYNDGVRAVDLSGNLIGEADLLEYMNSTKHAVGLPSLRMLSESGAREHARVEVHESLVALDMQSRLKRHGLQDADARKRRSGSSSARPASAPLQRQVATGKTFTNAATSPLDLQQAKPVVMIDFPPKTSAVNAVQRVILDSISRVEAHNPFRRTTEAGSRGRQSLQGDGGANAREAGTRQALSRQAPVSARSVQSSRSDSRGGRKQANHDEQKTSSSIRSRLRLPPKRAASAALLRTPAGLTPAERKHKYHDAEKKMKRARKEARMLIEAAAADVSVKATPAALPERGIAPETGSAGSAAVGIVTVEGDVTLRPRFGGTYAHEVFWPAFSCARAGEYSGLTEWLEKGMRVEAREPSTGQSLLMACACSSSEISMRMLIRKGARVNGQCNKGWTALHHCIASGSSHLYMADQLISRGARTEIRDLIGVTPLQLAVEQGSPDAICRLIEAGADIASADDEGRTVLHRCAARESFAMCTRRTRCC
jgi:hypothetical protein